MKTVVRMEKINNPGEFVRFEYGPDDPVRLLQPDGPFDVDPGGLTADRVAVFKDLIRTARARATAEEFDSDVGGLLKIAAALGSLYESAVPILGVMSDESSAVSRRLASIVLNNPAFPEYQSIRRNMFLNLNLDEQNKLTQDMRNYDTSDHFISPSEFKAPIGWIDDGEAKSGS